MFELMPQQMDVGRRIAQALCDNVGRKSLHEGCAERFIASLPLRLRVCEVRGISHGDVLYDVAVMMSIIMF